MNDLGNDKKSLFIAIAGVFFYLFLFLFLISVFGVVNGGSEMTLRSFLEMLQGVPSITIPKFINYSIVGDWGVFNVFKNFFNLFIIGVNFVVYIATCGVQLITYMFYFISYLFV